MPTESYELVGSYNNQRITSIDAERSINCFEYIDPLGKKPKSLLGTSGLINTNDNFQGAVNGFRGQFVFQGNMYLVIGADILKIDSSGNVETLGIFISTNVGYVGIDANTFQVIFVDGANGFIYDTIQQRLFQITDTSFPSLPLDVCTLDEFFIVINGNTNNFQLSMFDQGLIWGPDFTTGTGNAFVATSGSSPNLVLTTGTTLNYQVGTPIKFNGSGALPVAVPPLVVGTTYFVTSIVNATTFTISASNGGPNILFTTTGTAPIFVTNGGQLQQGSVTTHPGTLVACRTLHRRLFLFSQNFTEVWENQGIGTNLPFRRNNTLLIEYGTPAIGSVSVGFDKMYFLSQDRDGLGAVMQVDGTQAIPVSTRALDFQLAQYAAAQQITDCRSFLIKENGLIFYRMNFTAANHTFVYDVTLSDPSSEQTKLWHEEEVLNGNRHPAQTHGYFNGLNYVGHYALPLMYIVDSKTYLNDQEVIPRRRYGKPVGPGGYQRTRIDRFQVDFLQGNIGLEMRMGPLDILTETDLPILTETDIPLITNQNFEIDMSQNPRVFFSYSKDGGQTFGFKQVAPMGQLGQRSYRTLWRKLGVVPRGQYFVPLIEFFNVGPFAVLGASWSYEILPE